MKKTITRAISIIMAVMIVLGLIISPSFAQSEVSGADVNAYLAAIPFDSDGDEENDGVQLTKNMIIDKGANVPTETFVFEIAAGSDADAPDPAKDHLSAVYAGILPTTKTCEIAFDNDTNKGIQHDGTPADSENKEKEYYSNSSFFDFTGATFEKPGIYRYTISEKKGSNPAIDYDENTYTFDLYIGYADAAAEAAGTMSTLGYAIYDNLADVTDPSKKVDLSSFTFPNELSSDDLTISKTVAGKLGDKERFFNFTVNVEGTTDYTYGIELQSTAGAALTPEEGNNWPAGNEITANTNTVISLKDGQQIVIKELPTNMDYTVTEETVKADGYTVSVVTTENGTTGTSQVTADTGAGTKVVNTSVKGGNIEAFTNTNNPSPLTGIVIQVLPFALLVLIACAGMVALFSFRRKTVQK